MIENWLLLIGLNDIYIRTEVIPPYYWKKHKLTVVRDGYLEDGTRLHVVLEKGYENGVVLSNALVYSEVLG